MAVNRANASQDPTTPLPRRGFGVLGALPHDIVRELASAAESAGYHTFWVNDAADGYGLAALAQAAQVTTSIRLGIGAIPLDRQDPARIAARLVELELPVERLWLGVGAGRPAGGLERVRNGVAALREATGAALVAAAMGPRMCHLAGEIADGVLLDWAAPPYIERVTGIVADAAAETGGQRSWIASYIFAALGADAVARLRAEAAYYAAIPSYAAHFARMNAGPLETVAFGEEPEALRRELSRFDTVLDEPVVRAVVADETIGNYLALLRAAAPT